MLDFDQKMPHIVGHALAQQQANVRIQFIDIAHGMNAQAVFGHALVVAQACGALIARSGCNLCQSITHGVSPVLEGQQKSMSQRKL